MLRLVPAETPKKGPKKPSYLASSKIAVAGEESSCNIIPAILSIIFERCTLQGWVDYPILAPPPLNPPVSLPDESGYRTDNGSDDHHDTTDSSDNYSPSKSGGGSDTGGSGSSTYGSPDYKGKRVTRQSGLGQQGPKRQKVLFTEPVSK
jgi:hypothetical protein